MFNVLCDITITQVPSAKYPDRNKVLRIPAVNYYEWESGWQDFTDRGRVVIPKNIYFIDAYGKKNALKSFGVNIGGFGNNPLILRGDKLVLSAGYTYVKNNSQITEKATIINGFISKVGSGVPLELEVEDNMWLLKQTPLPNKTFNESNTLEDVLDFIVKNVNTTHGTSISYKEMTRTGFGTFLVSNESAAQVLKRLKSTYGFVSFFRGDVLHCGVNIQYADEVKTHVFYMNGEQGNIPADGQDLEYQRKDDVVLSAIAHNTITETTGGTTKDGHPKTKRSRISVLVTYQNNAYQTKVIPTGEHVPEAIEGERREFYFPFAKTTEELIRLTKDELERYYYTGLKGSFDTFAIPYVKHGDNVRLFNPELPEQDGLYRTKKVVYSGGLNGIRQTIFLYYKI